MYKFPLLFLKHLQILTNIKKFYDRFWIAYIKSKTSFHSCLAICINKPLSSKCMDRLRIGSIHQTDTRERKRGIFSCTLSSPPPLCGKRIIVEQAMKENRRRPPKTLRDPLAWQWDICLARACQGCRVALNEIDPPPSPSPLFLIIFDEWRNEAEETFVGWACANTWPPLRTTILVCHARRANVGGGCGGEGRFWKGDERDYLLLLWFERDGIKNFFISRTLFLKGSKIFRAMSNELSTTRSNSFLRMKGLEMENLFEVAYRRIRKLESGVRGKGARGIFQVEVQVHDEFFEWNVLDRGISSCLFKSLNAIENRRGGEGGGREAGGRKEVKN